MPPPYREENRSDLPCAGRVEDYTTPFLVVAGVLCYIILLALWILIGFPATLVGAFLADRIITRYQSNLPSG